MKTPETREAADTAESAPWALKLFVSSHGSASAAAIVQANHLLAEHLPKGSTLQVIDISRELEAAEREQILAIPTLVRENPQPARRIIGDLSQPRRVLALLGLPAP